MMNASQLLKSMDELVTFRHEIRCHRLDLNFLAEAVEELKSLDFVPIHSKLAVIVVVAYRHAGFELTASEPSAC